MRFGLLGPLAGVDRPWRNGHDSGGEGPVPVADLLVHAGEPMSADRLVEDPWNGTP
jgi:hypothetical protein